VKAATYEVHTRQSALFFTGKYATSDDIYSVALRLFQQHSLENVKKIPHDNKVRLLGIRCSGFDSNERRAVESDQRTLSQLLKAPSASNNDAETTEGGGGVNDTIWRCPRCSQSLNIAEKDEHADWHVAMDFQHAEKEANDISTKVAGLVRHTNTSKTEGTASAKKRNSGELQAGGSSEKKPKSSLLSLWNKKT
jgi:hypothetical protein